MFIKSHIRGGYRAAADYLKDVGANEKIRLVEISDHDAKNLDEAFHNMWTVASNTRCKKPLHHISINPFRDERLTDAQVLKIVKRCEEKYGYKPGDHQRVIVEHVLDGRQHFHVMWNRVSLATGKAVWPGHHWKKSKQVCREMEKELGLKRPMPRRIKRILLKYVATSIIPRSLGKYVLNLVRRNPLKAIVRPKLLRPVSVRRILYQRQEKPAYYPSPRRRKRRKGDQNIPDSEKMPFRRPEWETAEHLAWAWETRNVAVLAQYGIYLKPDTYRPEHQLGLEP